MNQEPYLVYHSSNFAEECTARRTLEKLAVGPFTTLELPKPLKKNLHASQRPMAPSCFGRRAEPPRREVSKIPSRPCLQQHRPETRVSQSWRKDSWLELQDFGGSRGCSRRRIANAGGKACGQGLSIRELQRERERERGEAVILLHVSLRVYDCHVFITGAPCLLLSPVGCTHISPVTLQVCDANVHSYI